MKFKLNPERPLLPKLITSGLYKGCYEVSLVGEYRPRIKAHIANSNKDGELIISGRLDKISEVNIIDFRDLPCYLSGQKLRIVSGYSGSGVFILILRKEHELDNKCDWYLEKYRKAISKRKRNKYYKRAKDLHRKANRVYCFYAINKKGKYVYD